jgi:hypothetical protein
MEGDLPQSLETAVIDFVLSGAARAARGQGGDPATMLIHTSQKIGGQQLLAILVEQLFGELRDEWRYQRRRRGGIRER